MDSGTFSPNEAERQLKLSEERFRSIFEAAAIGIATLGPQGEILSANPALLAMLGYGEAELRSLGIAGITHPDDLELDLENLRELLSGQIDHYTMEKRYFTKDGNLIWGSLVASLGRDNEGQPAFFVGMVTDITARKRAERALQYAISLRDEFIAIASHELRTPLTPIMLQNEVLARALAREENLAPERKEQLLRLIHISLEQVRHLNDLFENLLDLSKLESMDEIVLEKAPMDLVALARKVVEQNSQLIAKSGCSVTISGPTELVGRWDCARLEQVVTNLLTNALKFGARRPVEISVARQASRAVLSVKDQGLGISAENHSRIFDKFVRIAPITSAGGFGLGLYIVRAIVRAHGGDLELESEPGRGAKFTVNLPLGLG